MFSSKIAFLSLKEILRNLLVVMSQNHEMQGAESNGLNRSFAKKENCKK